MPIRYVDRRDAFAVADFMTEVVEYLPESDRAPYLQAIEDLEAGEHVTTERLAEVAKNLAMATYPARRATMQFFQTVGAKDEWKKVLESVRPTTRVLLERLCKNIECKSLDEVLGSSDASYAIHDQEEMELEALRPEIRLRYWQSHQTSLQKLVEDAQTELEGMKKRWQMLKQIAGRSPKQASTLLEKLEMYEDKVLFGGETIALEVLDQEVRYAAEEAAIPSTDDALVGAEDLPVRFVAEEEEKPEEPTEEKE